jgi:phage terminase large subunit
MTAIKGGKNLDFLITEFDIDKSSRQEKQGFVLEGGSGSGKTYDIINFLIYYCSLNKGKNKDILAFRTTLADLKKTVLKDFEKLLKSYNLWNDNNMALSQPMNYKLYGNVVYFSGMDTMGAHGERHDVIWGNEGVPDMDKQSFKQLNQRCNEIFLLDYNPVTTDHWIYDDIIPRDDTKFIKTTLLDNSFLPPGQRQEILAYQPTPENIRQGTADDYLWNVYGLGLRSAPEGLIFQHVTWVKEFPPNCERVYYGIDWGYTNDPTALTKVGIMGDKLFGAVLFYAPTPSFNEVEPVLKLVPKGNNIWADPSGEYGGRGLITMAQRNGYPVYAFNAFPGSKKFGLSLMKKYKIHFVDDVNLRKEQANYKYKTIHSIKLDEPIDGFDHAIDSMRGACIANLVK